MKILAAVAIFAAFAFMGCDSVKDEVTDEATDNVDTSFDKDKDLELAPVEVDETSDDPTPQGTSCGTTSVNAELDKAGVDLSEVDIDSITLQYVEASYSDAYWTPEEVTTISCVLIFGGAGGGSATVAETAVNGSGSDWTTIDVSEDAAAVINYYLSHRDEDFSYCVTCGDADTYHVSYSVNIGVHVSGEVKVD